MYVSKQIHLDEQAWSVCLLLRATFSPWGLHAPLLESRVATRNSVVRGGRAGTPFALYFSTFFSLYGRIFLSQQDNRPKMAIPPPGTHAFPLNRLK